VDFLRQTLVDFLNYRGPRTDMFRPGIVPGPPLREANTPEKSHSNSLFNCYLEPLQYDCRGFVGPKKIRAWAS
jgi:hypothetical protein